MVSQKFMLMSDILRVSANIEFYTDRSCKWLYYLFNKQIKSAIGYDIELELGQDSRIFNREKFYKLCGYDKVTEENYIEISKGNITDEAIDYFKTCFKDYFILFQEAGALKQVADLAQIRYLDIIISSIRFMDDLNFAFRSNVPSITNKLLKYRLLEEKIYYHANYIKSFYWGHGVYNNNLISNSLLLCGQTEVDLSLIKDGKLVTFLDYEQEIRELFSKYSKVYYKRHPYAKTNTENEQFILSFDNVELINDNFYKILSCDEITAVAALSSGTVKEAKYFDKDVIFISHPFINYYYNDDKEIKQDDFIIVNNDYFSPVFWSDILSDITETNVCDSFMFPNNRNILRESLNVFWGYQLGNKNNPPNNNPIIVHPHAKQREIVELDECRQEKIKPSDISVVVQGSISPKMTSRCLKSIRRHLPEAEIILSTWFGSDIFDLDYDILVLNDDPGAQDISEVTIKPNNVNRQIVSTLNGVKKASRKYVLKIRSDLELNNSNFLKYYQNLVLNKNFKREKQYSVFKKRILIDSYFTRNSEYNSCTELGLCFHPSDLWLLGLKEDIENLFDIPLQEQFIANVRGIKYQYRVPEQYIWTSCLNKHGWNIYMETYLYNTQQTHNQSIMSILNNFFVLDHRKCGIKFPKKFKNYTKRTFKSVLTTKRYFELYRASYALEFKLPNEFKYSNISDIYRFDKYIRQIKKAIKPLRFIWDIPCCIFKILIKIILNSYKLIWWLK